MQFCQAHWDYLRGAIETRGLSHLVARSGEEAVANEVAALEGRTEDVRWDPLMTAHWNLVRVVMERVGPSLLFGNDCPMCLVQSSYEWYDREGKERPPEAHDAHWWMDDCCDAMLAHAREQGLVAGEQ